MPTKVCLWFFEGVHLILLLMKFFLLFVALVEILGLRNASLLFMKILVVCE
jgi:hypothetical protein